MPDISEVNNRQNKQKGPENKRDDGGLWTSSIYTRERRARSFNSVFERLTMFSETSDPLIAHYFSSKKNKAYAPPPRIVHEHARKRILLMRRNMI